jgi:hypothetical protein
MFSWLQKDINVAASVLFRGNWPSTKESFNFLRDRGIQIADGESGGDGLIWSLELTHPEWGEATLLCTRDFPMPPELLIDLDAGLLDSEKEEVKACGTAVSLMVKSRRKHLLRDRKNAVRFMDAVMGEEGVAALDHVSQRFWSRAELKSEVAHDADVDVQSLFSAHFVGAEGDHTWYHTHGLAEIGLFDFDILDASEDVMATHSEAFRSIAFAIVEGNLTPGGSAELIAKHPLQAVPAADFMSKAAPEWTAIREDPSGDHSESRVVICDPPPRGLFGKFRAQVRPYSFFMKELPDGSLISFSNDASALMAERAMATYPLFRATFEELKPLEAPGLVKLGYRIDGGGELEKEHLWFQVHETHDNEIDATLLNQPFGIARMKEGDRGKHPIELISDWQFMTPVGPINPRDTKALRFLREAITKAKANGFDPNAAPEGQE